MINEPSLSKHVFIQKQIDNQLVTDVKDVFVELYDVIENVFNCNVASKAEAATEEELLALHIQYDYVLRSLENLKDAFVNFETGITC